MNTIHGNFTRVPTLLASQVLLDSLGRTSQELLRTQIELATGKAVGRPSDRPIAASGIAAVDDMLEQANQYLRNLSHADSVLNMVDASLAEATEALNQAHSIGLSESGVGSDAATRANQAIVIDSLLDQMTMLANRDYLGISLFGGTASGTTPMQALAGGGLQYVGVGDGLLTALPMIGATPITISGADAFGALSTRIEVSTDLQPQLTLETRLSDLGGAQGQGVALGMIELTMQPSGEVYSVDLAGCHTIGDVIDRFSEIADVTIAIDPISSLGFNVTPPVGQSLVISQGPAAADLGLIGTFDDPAGTVGQGLDPRISAQTDLASLGGLSLPLGSIEITNLGQTHQLDLSSAQNVGDLIDLVAALDIGVRMEIADSGDRLNVVNQASGSQMSIGMFEGDQTVEMLGIRSLTSSTLLSDFNNGMSIGIVSGSLDATTGEPDPAANMDFRINLANGESFEVDLTGCLIVGDVLNAVNQAALDAGVLVPDEFEASLVSEGNGFRFIDQTAVIGQISIEPLNGSTAIGDLGFKVGDGEGGSASLSSSDRATVAVESTFTHLMALRDALEANDERGISLATQKLETDLDRLIEVRAVVGVRSQRVSATTTRQEDLVIQYASMRSELEDLDYTEASIRFATLQQQLQAGLLTTGQLASMSLLDFLGP